MGGWQLTGIATFQRGFPFSVQANDSFSLLEAYNQRANVVSSPTSGFHKNVNEWFNTAAFTQPLAGEFGNSGRNILREPGINNWDMGLEKNFAISERANFQLRLETFNTFNHTQWGVDPTSPTAAAGGPGTGAVDRNVNDQPRARIQILDESRPPVQDAWFSSVVKSLSDFVLLRDLSSMAGPYLLQLDSQLCFEALQKQR